MKRRIFAIACVAAVTVGGASNVTAATAEPSPTRWGKLRRKLLRSHVVILLLGGAVIGFGAWWHRPRDSAADRGPPWERR
jgi:hypothetical protein